jgi:hypothetical protein
LLEAVVAVVLVLVVVVQVVIELLQACLFHLQQDMQ